MLNPRQYKIPDWFLNRQKDWKDGTFGQSISNGLDTKLREDLERLKKVKYSSFIFIFVQQEYNKKFRSALTVVSVTTGSSVSVVSIPRPLVAAVAPSVLPRRSKHPSLERSCSVFPDTRIKIQDILLQLFRLFHASNTSRVLVSILATEALSKVECAYIFEKLNQLCFVLQIYFYM